MNPETAIVDLSSLRAIVAGAAAAISFAALITTTLFWLLQNRSRRVERTYELFRQLYHHNFVSTVNGPSQSIVAKWFYLPTDQRENYRQEVVNYWLAFEDNDLALERFGGRNLDNVDFVSLHFWDIASNDGLTEARALSVYLHFWSGVNELLEAGLGPVDI